MPHPSIMGARKNAIRRGCSGKQRHDTKTQATAHLVSLFHSLGYKGRVYHCSFCGGYHVGRWHGRFR